MTKIIDGAKFKAQSFFRPTTMSLSLAEAGIIPGTHLKKDLRNTALLRHRADKMNIKPSRFVAF